MTDTTLLSILIGVAALALLALLWCLVLLLDERADTRLYAQGQRSDGSRLKGRPSVTRLS
jgi:hypothetical protein